jgi:hypothetical protein
MSINKKELSKKIAPHEFEIFYYFCQCIGLERDFGNFVSESPFAVLT